MSVRLLVIDNYDSFVYTLVGYLEQLGATVEVVRNDDVSPAQARELASRVDGIVISPGPGAPKDAGVSIDLVNFAAESSTPLLGVCLGHQAITEAFGGEVVHAPQLMHGKVSAVHHDGTSVFAGLPSPVNTTRYHSLASEPTQVPDALRVSARTEDGVIMALEHVSAPIVGVQFHPESVLTEGGYQMLGNWLETVGLAGARERSVSLSPLVEDGAHL
ncbi:anthranilate synthase component II [Haematomicrobium sanguinis]|uniref:anthranilate synthase component II n=1 Tax=Haematomicrobium sanguinis TaxID=479106 RepID=UPI000479325B|nr:aminodeoxychorismate/anthranilate synthase component II [Haematomicrobium sanguinis]